MEKMVTLDDQDSSDNHDEENKGAPHSVLDDLEARRNQANIDISLNESTNSQTKGEIEDDDENAED